jgi:plastocyanin
MGALVAVFVLGSADAVGPLSHPQATRSDPPTPSPGVTVWPGTYGVVFVSALRGMVYDAYDLRVDRGDTIVFTVRADDSSHSFTVNDDLDSGPLSTDETKRMRVTLPPGVYDYRCTVVPYMVGGKLTVGPVPLSTPMGPGPTRPSPAR